MKLKNLLQCNACGHANQDDVKFCAGCGHSLYEPCKSCAKPVLLGQKFCGSCGADLESVLNSKRQQYSELLAEAIHQGKSYNFDESIHLLNRVIDQDDHRFSDIVDQSRQALEKIQVLRDQTVASAEKRMERAREAAERDDKLEAVRLLNKVPEPLRDEASRSLLAKFQSHQEETTALIDELKSAMKDVNYNLAGNLIDQLLQLNPNEPKFEKMAQQVSAKLLKSANSRFAKRDYAGAIDKLNSICSICRDEAYEKTHQNVSNVKWLVGQCKTEPFVTPALVKIAIRLAKLIPDDQEATAQAKKFIAAIKQRPSDPRTVFAPARPVCDGVLGGEVSGHLAFPSCLDFSDYQPFRQEVARYNVAIGLAIQGVGLGRFEGSFQLKKSLLGSLGRRKKDTCWGVDVGNAGVRAVKLRRIQESKKAEPRLEVVDTFWHEFEFPLSHVSMTDRADALIKETLERFAETKQIADENVWANLNGSQLISRFVRLPPVKDKQAEKLLDQEIESRIPFALDDLEVIRWIADLDKASATGRPAMVIASRKQVVQSRFECFKEAGIELAGIQSEPLALANLAALEFNSLWNHQEASADDEAADSAGKDSGQDDSTAVAIVDCGAATTTLLLVARQAVWFWTIESGGEDMTTIAAKTTGKVQSDAEQLKRDPASITQPARTFARVEDKMANTRARFLKLIDEAEKQVGGFDIKYAWCTGGGALTHGWVRGVLMRQTNE
mgnify:CR=1 FL=1|tara:strand:+ start:1001859 stop:1004036 length:2178 start_codon:yes stop_codon:yes gene_type:complete